MKTFVAIIAALVGVSAAPVPNHISISPTSGGFAVIQALLHTVTEVSKSADGRKWADLDSIIRTTNGTTVQQGPSFKVEGLVANAQFYSTPPNVANSP